MRDQSDCPDIRGVTSSCIAVVTCIGGVVIVTITVVYDIKLLIL